MFILPSIVRLIEALGGNKRQELYGYAKTQLGTKQSGWKAPIEYGCAEAVNRIVSACFGSPIDSSVSTTSLYETMRTSARFLAVQFSLPGDIVISPTGYGHGALPNGHVGIVSDGNKIMSNNSADGIWGENYTLDSWRARYIGRGGYPMLFFRVIM